MGDKDNGVRFTIDGAMAVALMTSCRWLLTTMMLPFVRKTVRQSWSSAVY